jgi:hypothetical protein
MKVIGLCGYAGSGKDTAAEALVSEGWQRIAFADPVREMALAIDPYIVFRSGDRNVLADNPIIFWNDGSHLQQLIEYVGWDEAKRFMDVRRLLQRIGTEAGREILGPNVWVDVVSGRVTAAAMCGCHGVVITDLRFDNELHYLRYRHSTIVRISRPGVGPVNDHESDQHLAGFEVDHEIVNDGDKEKLWAAIRAIAKAGE